MNKFLLMSFISFAAAPLLATGEDQQQADAMKVLKAHLKNGQGLHITPIPFDNNAKGAEVVTTKQTPDNKMSNIFLYKVCNFRRVSSFERFDFVRS